MIAATALGDPAFKADYGLKYAYVAGAMYRGIASAELVVALGRAGLIGFFGTGGLDLDQIERAIDRIQSQLAAGERYGMNLLSNLEDPAQEERTIDLYLKRGIRFVEASAFTHVTPSLVRYRLQGARRRDDGALEVPNRLLAKVSRPEVAAAFMQPGPESIVQALAAAGKLTATQAQLAAQIPMAHDICVEADSGGHTDRGVAYALLPAIQALRDEQWARHRYPQRIRVGAAGGIGTPQAAAAAFIMGADFILTGSINQCTREAGTSEAVKSILQQLNVQDTAYAPAGDMFELGAKIQVVRLGVLFAARANKLYELYMRHGSLEEIEARTRQQLEQKYFKRSLEQVWQDTRRYHAAAHPHALAELERNPKRKMAAVFKWYFAHTTRLALDGVEAERVDYQIHCGPALGAFNQWVKGTPLEAWQARGVADVAERLMQGTAELLAARYRAFSAGDAAGPHLRTRVNE